MARVLKRGGYVTLEEVREAAEGFLALRSLGGGEDPEFSDQIAALAEIGAAICEGMRLPPELGVFLRPDTILPELAMRKFLEWEARLESRPD